MRAACKLDACVTGDDQAVAGGLVAVAAAVARRTFIDVGSETRGEITAAALVTPSDGEDVRNPRDMMPRP